MLSFFLNNIEFFLFVLFLIVFLFVKRKNLEIQGSFPFFYVLMYKAQWGISLMKSWAKKYPKTFMGFAKTSFWLGIVGVFVSFFLMLWQTIWIYNEKLEVGGGFLLPIKTDAGLNSVIPVFYVPFFEWIVALFLLVVVHEFAHGVVSKRFGIKVKSSGFAFLGIGIPFMPAAFVEPDEKQIKKATFFEKVGIYGAGSTSNFLFGIIFLILLLGFSQGFKLFDLETEFKFNEVSNQSELLKYNITKGKIIQVENETNPILFFNEFKNTTTLNLTIINQNNLTQNVLINKFYEEKQNKSFIGINQIEVKTKATNSPILFYIFSKFIEVLKWTFLLNLLIGIANLLPIWITDGGQIFREICLKYVKNKKTAYKIYNFVSILVLIMIIITLFPSLIL
jgi:membrane-associated protease RseP (regulator of RpoE activity)